MASPEPSTGDGGQHKGASDPFLQPNFDVQAYVNRMFPNGEAGRAA